MSTQAEGVQTPEAVPAGTNRLAQEGAAGPPSNGSAGLVTHADGTVTAAVVASKADAKAQAKAKSAEANATLSLCLFDQLQLIANTVPRKGTLKSHLDAVTEFACKLGIPNCGALRKAREEILRECGRTCKGEHTSKGVARFLLSKQITKTLAGMAKEDDAFITARAGWKRASEVFGCIAGDTALQTSE